MKDLLILIAHLFTAVAKLLGPNGARAVVADSLLIKQQLMISNRHRKRAPRLTPLDRFLLGFWSLFLTHRRIQQAAIIIFRASLPRFSAENIDSNLAIVAAVRAIAESKGCTPAQVALAWLLSKGNDIVPIPGTKRLEHLEENTQSLSVQWSTQDSELLEAQVNQLEVVGNRYTDEGMKGVEA